MTFLSLGVNEIQTNVVRVVEDSRGFMSIGESQLYNQVSSADGKVRLAILSENLKL